MPPKKQKQDEWNECLKCKHVVHKRDVSEHKDNCKATHGFVIGNVLHAVVATVPVAKQTKDVVSKQPPANQENTLLVNPDVMWLCQLDIGQPCLVNGSHVLTAWPCGSVHPTSVCLPPLLAGSITELGGADEGRFVTVERFFPSGAIAQRVEIELEWRHQAFVTEEFSEILKCMMEGRYITHHGKYTVRYLGLKCNFCIRAIQCVHCPQYELIADATSPGNEVDPDRLCQNLSSLDISGISDSGDNLNTSTSVTPSKYLSANDSTVSDDTMSPVTPVRSKVKRPEQFCTPVIEKRREGVEDTSAKFVKVTAETQFVLREKCSEESKVKEQKVMFDSLGGLDSQIDKVKQYCLLPLLMSKHDSSVDPAMPRGILLFGPTGTGKSMLAQAVANELNINTTHISPTELYSKFFGETEKKLRNVFETARQRAPSLIVVDNIDVLCGSRDSSQTDLEKRTVATFLTLMDGVATKSSRETCLVIGITSKPDTLSSALRRPGRFDLEIETGVPTAADRLQILKKLLQDVPHCVSDADLKVIADAAHGYVGADLAGVVLKARQDSWRLTRDTSAPVMTEALRQAATQVPPSAMREVQLEVPQVRWADIGGQEEVKLKLRQAVEWPLTHPEAFQRIGIAPPRGCLMYGPPGCSKTMIAKALATESGLNFLAVKGPELFGKYVGESERAVREIFRKARSAAPSIIFFDEIDSLAVERGKSGGGNNVADRVLTQLLTEMDGVVQLKGVTIVGATNRPDMIDKALLRPGRFDRILYVPLPDAATRKEILQIITRKTPVAPDVPVEELVNRTERYSGAELTALCHEAGLCAITESREARIVHMHHFEAAFKTVRPQTTAEMIKFYEEYSSRSGLHSV